MPAPRADYEDCEAWGELVGRVAGGDGWSGVDMSGAGEGAGEDQVGGLVWDILGVWVWGDECMGSYGFIIHFGGVFNGSFHLGYVVNALLLERLSMAIVDMGI